MARSARWAMAMAATAVALGTAGAGTAAAGDYSFYDADSIAARSTDGVARSYGTVRWYDSGGDFIPVRRGDYSRRAKVRALKPVGCIWAKVSYKWLTGSLTVGTGGAGGSISGAEYTQDGYYASCRGKGAKRPKAISLYGVGYARRAIRSTTLELCTSKTKADGPRFCAFEKNSFGGD